MAFVLAAEKKFELTVVVHMPGNAVKPENFNVKYRNPSTDELEELRELPPKDVLRRVVVGFSDLKDEDGNLVEFSEANLEALILIPQALNAMHLTFWNNLLKGKEKN